MPEANGVWTLEEARSSHLHSPALAEALTQHLPVAQPVVDLGCGMGYYALALQQAGWKVRAFDGTPDLDSIGVFRGIEELDLSQPFTTSAQSSVICLEVGEHIPLECEQTFLDNLAANTKRRLILSWAIPNQGGKGHINERPNDYIINEMGKRGFVFKPEPTNSLRSVTEDNVWWFKDSLMVFDRLKVGLAVIAKNERKNIGRAIDSVIDFVDEFCFDLSGTTDDTEAVATKHLGPLAGSFFHDEWLGPAESLNRCIRNLDERGCDWIIRLDADTTMEGELPDLATLPSDIEGVSIPITNDDGWRVCYRAWVFRPTAHYKGVRHEGLWVSKTISWDDLRVVHHRDSGARPREAATYLADAEAMLEALKTEEDEGLRTRYVFYIAKAYRDADEPLQALAYYRQRVTMGGYYQEVGFALREIAILSESKADWANALSTTPERADTAFYALQSALSLDDPEWLAEVVALTEHQEWDERSMFADPSYHTQARALLSEAGSGLNPNPMIPYPLWLMWEEAISPEVCDEWLESCRRLPTQDAVTFGGHGDTHRKTNIRWVNPEGDSAPILDALWEYVQRANEVFNLDVTHLPPLQFTEYAEAGHHYSTHHDINWNREDGLHRKISITVQLSDSDDYTGGEFSFNTTENPDPTAVRKKGTILCFLSYLDHMVSPIESGSRTSLVGWAEGPRWR